MHPRSRLPVKNGASVRRINGVTSLTNGHLTSDSLHYAIDAKLAELDAKISGHEVDMVHVPTVTPGANGLRIPDVRTRNLTHDLKFSVEPRQNRHDVRLNGFVDHKIITADDAKRTAESRSSDCESRLNGLHNVVNGLGHLLGATTNAPTIESRLPLHDTKPNSDVRHSPRHSLANGACVANPNLLNNNSKNSVNNNNNNGYVQPQFLVNQSLKQSLSNVKRPPDFPLPSLPPGRNLRQCSSPTSSNNSVIKPQQITIVSTSATITPLPSYSCPIRVPIYPCPTSTVATVALPVPQPSIIPQEASSHRISATSTSNRDDMKVSHPNVPSTGNSRLSCSIVSGPSCSSSSSSSSSSNSSSGSSTPVPTGSSATFLSLSSGITSSTALSEPSSSANFKFPPKSVGNGSGNQPSVVRFPAVPNKKDLPEVCKWKECGKEMDPNTSLLEHIQVLWSRIIHH